MPVATGAAVACPDRKVVNLEADGSAMYQRLQSLWTQAREHLDVTTIIFDNRAYAILNLELSRVGARTDGNCRDQFDLVASADRLRCARARHGRRRDARGDGREFVTALEHALAEPGPHLIDAIIPARL